MDCTSRCWNPFACRVRSVYDRLETGGCRSQTLGPHRDFAREAKSFSSKTLSAWRDSSGCIGYRSQRGFHFGWLESYAESALLVVPYVLFVFQSHRSPVFHFCLSLVTIPSVSVVMPSNGIVLSLPIVPSEPSTTVEYRCGGSGFCSR